MKTMISIIILLLMFNLGLSQTSKHIEIIEVIESKETPLLLDKSSFSSNENFNPIAYSLELKKQSKNFNIQFKNTGNVVGGHGVLSFNNFKKQAFSNFEINYRRQELKRLLPGPPTFENFCPEFNY